jgi:hypothetical protein
MVFHPHAIYTDGKWMVDGETSSGHSSQTAERFFGPTGGRCRRSSPDVLERSDRFVLRDTERWLLPGNLEGAVPRMRIRQILHPAVVLAFADVRCCCDAEVPMTRIEVAF